MPEFEHGMETGDPRISPPADEVGDLNKKRAQLVEHWDQLHTTLQDPINEHDTTLRAQLDETSEQIGEIDVQLQTLAEQMHAEPAPSAGPPLLPTPEDDEPDEVAVNHNTVRNIDLDTDKSEAPLAGPPLIIGADREQNFASELPTPPDLPESPEFPVVNEAPPVSESPQVAEVSTAPAEPKESDEARQARLERETQIENGIRARFTEAIEAKIARKSGSISPERQQFTREMAQQFLDDMYAAHELDNPETPQRLTKMDQATQEALKGLEADDVHEFQRASDHMFEGRMLSGFLSHVGTPSGGTGWFTRSEGRNHGEGSLLNRLHDAQGAIAYLKTLNLVLAYMKGMSPPNMKPVTGSFDPDCYQRITRNLFEVHLPLKPTSSGAFIADETRIEQMWRQAQNESRGFYGPVSHQPEIPDNQAIEAAFIENLERVQQIDKAVTERERMKREADQQAQAKELATVTAKIGDLEKHTAAHEVETPESIQKKISDNEWGIETQQGIITANKNALETQSTWDKWTQSKRLKNEITEAEYTIQRLKAAHDGLKVKLAQAQHRAEILASESLDDLRARKQQLEASVGSPRL